jgi:hypothetical protein
MQGNEAEQFLGSKIDGLVSLDTSPFCVFFFDSGQRVLSSGAAGNWFLRDAVFLP